MKTPTHPAKSNPYHSASDMSLSVNEPKNDNAKFIVMSLMVLVWYAPFLFIVLGFRHLLLASGLHGCNFLLSDFFGFDEDIDRILLVSCWVFVEAIVLITFITLFVRKSWILIAIVCVVMIVWMIANVVIGIQRIGVGLT